LLEAFIYVLGSEKLVVKVVAGFLKLLWERGA
jgi:hypothetical protein